MKKMQRNTVRYLTGKFVLWCFQTLCSENLNW